MTTVAVVGGTGFLGRHVVAVLERAGYSVRALSRRNGFDALSPDPEFLRGTDAVVNLAGIKREDGQQTFHGVHVELVGNLVAAMKSAGIRRLIHISVVVARPAPDLPYHDTKWKGEEVVRASGLDYTILRPGVIYGDGDDMLSHLALMIRTSPVFPIVGNGSSPMRPVDVWDVAAAVLAALRQSGSGKTYEIVGPERLELRDVVRRVAEALNLPLWIWPTPVALMRGPVHVMEAVMKQPLSTRAQLAMLVEGLDGDPGPARAGLGLSTAPFSAERIRPLLEKTNRVAPFSLRLLSSPGTTPEMAQAPIGILLGLVISALTVMFRTASDPWTGMMLVMTPALAGAMLFSSVRRRVKPSLFRIATGLVMGVAFYGLTLLVLTFLTGVWPEWETAARQLYAWRGGHTPVFLGMTLVLIVIAEEFFWRGVVTRHFIERWGRGPGIAAAAGVYALAHWATFNPLLLAAAFGCGIYWGWLYSATDDLAAPVASHLLWDVMLLFMFPVV
jgi:NADH dehydrogenase